MLPAKKAFLLLIKRYGLPGQISRHENLKKGETMASTPSRRKPASKTAGAGKTSKSKRQPKKSTDSEAKEIFTNISDATLGQYRKMMDKLGKEVEGMPHMSDETREQLKRLGDKLSVAADKGMHVAKDVAERVRHFATEATELTKLKIEIHKLKSDPDRLLLKMGERLWNLNKSKKLKDIGSVFKNDFKKLDGFKADIASKEKEAGKISL